jgi:hypothetical protein
LAVAFDELVLAIRSTAGVAASACPGSAQCNSASQLARILDQQAEAFREAQEALDRKDLGAYQPAIDRLGALIRQAQQAAARSAPATTTPGAAEPGQPRPPSGE